MVHALDEKNEEKKKNAMRESFCDRETSKDLARAAYRKAIEALHQAELHVWKEGRGERKREVDDDGEAHSRSRRDVCVRLDVTEKRRTQVLRERLFQVWRDDEEGDAG